MPVKGIILIFLVAAVVAVVKKDQVYVWFKTMFSDDEKDSDE